MQSSCALRHNDNNNELRWGGASETRVASTILNNDHISQSQSRGQFIMSDNFKQTSSHGGEDMRVSKLIRRLLNEDSVSIWLDIFKKLEVAMCIPANVTYINRYLDGLLETLLAVMKKCPPACAMQLIAIVGLIGYIGRTSFPMFEAFVRKTYKANKRLQKELVLALKTILGFDAEKRELDIYSERIIQLLKEFLENVETGDMFIIVTSTTVCFAKNYTYIFEQHFTDIVDIVIGWHLESKEKKQVRDHCSYVLQEFAPYFKNKLPFTFGLLSQFIEDIAGLSDQVISELTQLDSMNLDEMNKSEKELTVLNRVGSFVGAFNSLLKCLLQNINFANTPMFEDILGQALKAISRFSLKIFDAKTTNTETTTNINELYSICLMSSLNAIDKDEVQKLAEAQLLKLSNFDEQNRLSALYLTLCLVRAQRSTLQTDFVKLIFNNETQSELYKYFDALKLCVNDEGYKLLLRIHQEVLLTKNVPLLQMAYKCLTADITKCITVLTSVQTNRVTSHERLRAEAHLNFNLSALAALATQTSSIIAMYACSPSILDLLMINCRADDVRAWVHNATMHHSILILLIAHCQTNHNYRNTSRIFQCSDTSSNTLTEHTSPTAENFTSILRFITHCLEQAAYLNVGNLKVILKWTLTLLVDCKESAAVVYHNEYFMAICKAVNGRIAMSAPMECSACIEVIMSYVPISVDLLLLIRETSLHQLDTLDSATHVRYANIYANLPLSITLSPKSSSRLPQDELTQNYRASKNYASIRDKFFKIFLDTFDDKSETLLSYTLEACFAERLIDVHDKQIDNYLCHARHSYRMLNNWLQFEVARYMVEQKLRTCVGKPQDTFLAIEAIIMRFARLMSNPKELTDCENAELTLKKSVCTQRKIRFLLGFLDALEKQVYNAAEGSAFAYNPPEKPARSFFRLNTSTCHSWFSRIRPGIILVAMHSMEPETVLRYSEEVLMLLKPNDEQPVLQNVVYITWALLSCNESDTLEGLYAWVRAKTGKRFQWIQWAAEQAAGRKENAIVGYRALLSDYDLDKFVRQFIIAQIMECLNDTGQWSNLKKFKQQLIAEDANYMNPFTQRKNSDLSKLEMILGNYERSSAANEDLAKALNDLTIWPDKEKEANEACRLSQFYFGHVLENICVEQALTKCVGNVSLSVEVQRALDLSWYDALLSTSSGDRQRTNTILLKHVADQLLSDSTLCTITPVTCDSSFFGASKRSPIESTVLTKCLGWSLLLEKRTNPKVLNSLYLDIAESARKECNYKCCQTMLERFFARRDYTTPLPDISAQLLNDRNYQLNIADTELLRGYSEIAKWLNAQEKPNEVESINLGAALCLRIHKQIDQLAEQRNYPTISADMLLTLADWLTHRNSNGVPINNPILQHLLGVLPELPLAAGHNTPEADKIIGRLINASIHQQESCEEAWMAFGNWCYRWGKRVVEARSSDNSSLLSSLDILQMKEAIGDNGSSIDTGTIYQLVGILNKHANDSSEDIEPNDEYSTSTELLKCELRNFDILSDKPATVIDEIIQIWRQASKSIYDFYEASARAYFRYLCLKSTNTSTGERKHRYHVDDCSMVTTTLRLLRLIVKHAVGLQEVLEEGLKTTPIQPWKVIIPQLFSRLNHHEPYVRKSVSELLCRLADNRPHLVIFPAVVGANRELKTLEQCQASETSVQLSNCFSSLLNTLSKQAPQTVAHVQLLVKELKRVCLLWDEYWIHSLAHIYTNYLPCINLIDSEFKPTDLDGRNKRFNTFRDQIVTDLENVVAFTARNPETDYEHTFKDRFDDEIKRMIEDMRTKKFPDAWDRLKQLYNVLQHNQIRGNSATLKMQTVSPVLANMTKTNISMPGIDLYEHEQIYIRAVETTVRILPTKTKPKKVAFYGSNGQRYTYLFKGLEDLHLDERIMQFLSISNSIMAHKNDPTITTTTAKTCFKAHHYSVIPLGPQSGLISWVDGVTPLFALYKKWQQREAQLKLQLPKTRPCNDAISRANCPNEAEQVAPTKRLTELFYGKLTPLLAKHNMKVTDPRKQWPLPVLRQVYNELTKETPRDLLARELWCNAVNAAEWRKSVRCYTASMAVMSVIGYVIGLGDRHLDNVLINLECGEIVHIDYNVCFEKGKTLRIPEKVPFRLTQNFVEALGITGVEGPFRLGCEYVLKMMRKERETLLTLLEAFVYDPLVDWTVGEDGAVNRRAIVVKAAALNMNASSTSAACKTFDKYAASAANKKHDWNQTRLHIVNKLGEIHNSWMMYNVEIDDVLKVIESNLDELLKTRADMQQAELERDELVKQSALIREIKSLGTAMASHSFNSAAQRYLTKKHFTKSLNEAQGLVASQYDNISSTITFYKDCTQVPATLIDLSAQLLKPKFVEHDWQSEYQLVAEVLSNSRASLAKYQCARLEMDVMRMRINDISIECLQHLQQYVAIVRFTPAGRLKRNPYILFEQTFSHYIKKQQQQERQQHQSGSSDTDIDLALLKPSPTNADQHDEVVYIATTLKQVWSELTYELHQANYQLETEKNSCISVNDAINALLYRTAAEQTSYCSTQFYCGLAQVIYKCNKTFELFEKSAVAAEDDNLLMQQCNYVDVINTMFEKGIGESVLNNSKAFKHLSTLKSTFKSIVELKEFFQYDLAENILRLFLISNEHDVLDRLCDMSPSQLYEAYTEATEVALAQEKQQQQQQEQEQHVNKQQTPLSLRTNELEFFSLLSRMCALHKKFIGHLLNVWSLKDQLLAQIEEETDLKMFMQSNILCNEPQHLDLTTLFEAVHQCLLVAKIYDVRQFSAPISYYVMFLERKYLVGLVPLFTLEILANINAHVNANVNGAPTHDMIMLFENLYMALQHDAQIAQHQYQIAGLNKLIELMTVASSAHNWANEDALQDTDDAHQIHRVKLLDNIFTKIDALKKLVDAAELLQVDLGANIVEILKEKSNWNRNHVESFVRGEEVQKQFDKNNITLAKRIANYGNAVCIIERFGLENDSDNSKIHTDIEHWNYCYTCWRLSNNAITTEEEATIELLNPEGPIDNYWLSNINGLLEDLTCGVQRKITYLESMIESKEKSICDNQHRLQQLLNATHCTEMRALVSLTAKVERNMRSFTSNILTLTTRLRDAHDIMKNCSAKLGELRQFLINLHSNITDAHVTELRKKLEVLRGFRDNEETKEAFHSTQEYLQRANVTKTMQCESTMQCKVAINPCEQKRNAYGVMVWKKIRMKLEGREPDSSRRTTVTEQIDHIINEATNIDNLSVLYEGWTPWV